ncbi:MAG: hypothetical protein EA412_12905 [Chitinophagaceae bacterium]|nr:MAG: hypothetical protein EA412_12905 [Chitinophagaceae bacterium]
MKVSVKIFVVVAMQLQTDYLQMNKPIKVKLYTKKNPRIMGANFFDCGPNWFFAGFDDVGNAWDCVVETLHATSLQCGSRCCLLCLLSPILILA